MTALLVVDNHDSFTFTLVDYLRTLGAGVTLVQSDAVTLDQALAAPVNGYLLSPGPGHPQDAGISVPLAAACIAQHRPLLGVCLGQQAIGLACGASLTRVPPVHGKPGPITHDGSGIFAGLPSPLTATRYHSMALTDLPPALRANAWSDDGVIQGIAHASAPVHAVQFHPESVLSQHGHALLAAFLRMCA